MSNRIRILFHCSQEGAVAHVGQRAIEALTRYVQGAQKTEWLTNREWVRRGRPPVLDRKMRVGEFSLAMNYLVAANPLDIKTVPQFKNLQERLQWLWKHLPSEVRQNSVLTVTRESRMAPWRQSAANPIRYGWTLKKAKKQAAPPPAAPGADGSPYYVGSYWDDIKAKLYGMDVAASNTPSPEVAQQPVAGGFAPLPTPGSPEPTSGIQVGGNVAYKIEYEPVASSVSQKIKQALAESANKKFKAKPKKPSNLHWNGGEGQPEEPIILEEGHPDDNPPSNKKGAKPAKKTLRLGIWA